MKTRLLPVTLLIASVILVVALIAMNPDMTKFSLLGLQIVFPVGVLVAGGYLLGVGLTLPLIVARLQQDLASGKALTKWDHEDNKLALQVQSDREQQLEAKVATLETALKKALQKK